MHPWSPKDFKSKPFKSSGNPATFEAFDFKDTFYFSIPRLYDSHIHLQGIGKFSGDRNLSHCTSLVEVKTQLEKLIPSGFRSPTDLGYHSEVSGSQAGSERYLEIFDVQTDFEHHAATSSGSPADSTHYVEAFGLMAERLSLKDLCQWATHTYPHVVFCLVLEDGHRALFTGGLLNQRSLLLTETQYIYDDTAKIIGTLVGDQLRSTFEALLSTKVSLVESPLKLKQDLLTGQKILVQNGFTHCRDMTSDPLQFQTLLELEKNQKFFVYTDLYFSNFKGESLEELLKQVQTYKHLSSPRIQLKGIKVFLDGTLSGNNLDCSCAILSSDVATYKTEDIYEILKSAHEYNLEVAFHCIGDLAFEKIILALKKLATHTGGHLPYTHFEHCEFINDQSLRHLADLKQSYPQSCPHHKLHFHFQPSHWILDHDKVPTQAQNLHFFAWDLLPKMGFPNVFFGSDAPVTPPFARLDHKHELCSFLMQKSWATPWWTHFIYPDRQRGPLTFTLFQDSKSSFKDNKDNTTSICKVFIDGKLISL